MAFEISASRADFPLVEQGARLTRCIDSDRKPAQKIETEFLLCSRPTAQLNLEQMLWADRRYWGIETGLHLRLDVSAGEDRSRVRNRTAALNLAVMRRAAISVAVHWIQRCSNPRQATTSGFFDHMKANNRKRGFALVTSSKPSWLPKR